MILNSIKRTDKTLLFGVLFLIILGLITIFSVSYSGNEINFINFEKQFVFFIIGFIAMTFASSFDYRLIKNYTGVIFILTIVSLSAVLFLGSDTRGTNSWFNFGFFSFQPSEVAKVSVIIILAKYLSKIGLNYNIYKKTLISGLYTLLPLSLILMQPDLGSSLVIAFIWFSIMSVFGFKKKHIAFFILLGIIISILSWNFAFKDYQKNRIMTFINPQEDPLGSGYNVIQSIVAIGSGNVWGKGLGHGSQSQLDFLPEKHTDFIFAVIAEEMGLIGTSLVLILFTIIFLRILKIAEEAQDNFGRILCLGVFFMLIFHMIVNIGMNIGIMPVTGIPLPFVSYGGSSLIAFMISIGIIQSIYINGRKYRIDKEGSNILEI